MRTVLLLAIAGLLSAAGPAPRTAVSRKDPKGLEPVRSGPVDYRHAKAKAYAWTVEVYRQYPDLDRPLDRKVRNSLDVINSLCERAEYLEWRKWDAIGIFMGDRRVGGIAAQDLRDRTLFIFETQAAYVWGSLFPRAVRQVFEDPKAGAKVPPWPESLISYEEYSLYKPLAGEINRLLCEAAPDFKVDKAPYCERGGPPPDPILELPTIVTETPPPLR